jgi:hypothetical protein
MSMMSENMGKIACSTCPLMNCVDQGSCYNCYCSLDEGIELDDLCDQVKVHPECPLITGLIVTIYVDKGDLIRGKSYQ